MVSRISAITPTVKTFPSPHGSPNPPRYREQALRKAARHEAPNFEAFLQQLQVRKNGLGINGEVFETKNVGIVYIYIYLYIYILYIYHTWIIWDTTQFCRDFSRWYVYLGGGFNHILSFTLVFTYNLDHRAERYQFASSLAVGTKKQTGWWFRYFWFSTLLYLGKWFNLASLFFRWVVRPPPRIYVVFFQRMATRKIESGPRHDRYEWGEMTSIIRVCSPQLSMCKVIYRIFLGIQSPSENGNGTQIPFWEGGYTPQSSSDKVIGSLGHRGFSSK